LARPGSATVPIDVDPPWLPVSSAGASATELRAFAPAQPRESPDTVWIKFDESPWPLRAPPDRLEVDEVTPQAEFDRLRHAIDPATGGIPVSRHRRGLPLGRLAPGTRPGPPWRENAPIIGFTAAGARALVGGEAWYRSAPRDHYTAAFLDKIEQTPAVSPPWDASHPPLAYPVLAHRVPPDFNFGPKMPDVHVFYPLVSVATVEGLPEPYLVRVSPRSSTSSAGPDVLPDPEAPRQGSELLDDLILSGRSRLHSAAPGFAVPDQPARARPTAAQNLPLQRRLPSSPSEQKRLRGDRLRLALVAAACGLLLWSIFAWGRQPGL
jgi:hypothetical protein